MTVLAQAKCYGASHHEADQEGEHVEAVDWFVSLSPGMTELGQCGQRGKVGLG